MLNISTQKFQQVIVSMNSIDQPPIIFDTPTFSTSSRASLSDRISPNIYVFEPVNQYFAYLHHSKQKEIFELYQKLKAATEISVHKKSILETMGLVKELLDVIDKDLLSNWIIAHSNIPIPDLTNDRFENNESEDRKYNTSDYHGLIILTMCARFLIPVFGHMCPRLTRYTPKFREHIMFNIIKSSWLYEHPAMVKLSNYLTIQVESELSKSKTGAKELTAVMDSLSTDNLPDYIIALSFIKKVGIYDIYGNNDSANLIKVIYKYAISSVMGSLDKKFSGNIKERDPVKDRNEGDANKISCWETFKGKSAISEGDKVLYNYTSNNIDYLFDKLLVDPEQIKVGLEINKQLKYKSNLSSEIETELILFKQAIVAIVMHNIIAAPMISVLDALAFENCLRVSIVKLLIDGHYDIAALLSSMPYNGQEEDDGEEYCQTTRPSAMPRELSSRIGEAYGIYWKTSNAKSVESQVRSDNPGTKSVIILSEKLQSTDRYIVSIPEEYWDKCIGKYHGLYNYCVPKTIRTLLGELVYQFVVENQL